MGFGLDRTRIEAVQINEYQAYLHTTQNAYMQKLYIANMVCDIYTIFAYINIKLSEIIFIKIIKGLYKKKNNSL